MADQRGWKRLGDLLVARRAQLGYPRRAAFLRAKDAGRFERIAGDLEAGNRDNYEPGTLAYAEHLYEWLPGSITQVLAGGDPIINSVDLQKKITEGVRGAFGYEPPTAEHIVPVGASDEDEDDPVLFLLTAEENQRLGRLPAGERRRVLDAARAAARATADALLGTGDEE